VRLALISDLHGNELAVRAVLADARARGVDVIACLGDVATLGPRPREVLDLVRGLDGPRIMGNHDAFMLDPELIHRYTEAPIIVAAVDWCRAQLDAADLDTIRGFEPTHALVVDDATTVLLYHGTPRSHMEDLLADAPDEQIDEMLGGRRATVMAGGHTHLPMVRRHRGGVLVNPGSVGLPFARRPAPGHVPEILPHASYAIVDAAHGDAEVELVRIDLDRRALAAQAAASACPLAPALAAVYA